MRSTSSTGCSSQAATFTYDGTHGPHAVTRVVHLPGAGTNVSGQRGNFIADFHYDEEGNQVARTGPGVARFVEYNPFNKPQTIRLSQFGNLVTEYVYGPERQLVFRHHDTGPSESTVFMPFPGFDRWYSGTTPTDRVTIETPDGTKVVYNRATTTSAFDPTRVEYVHGDQLGSSSIVTDHTGNVVEEYAYDPFGRHRDPDTGDLRSPEANRPVPNRTTDAAYTGQRQEPGHNLYN